MIGLGGGGGERGLWEVFYYSLSPQAKQSQKKVINIPTPFCNLDML